MMNIEYFRLSAYLLRGLNKVTKAFESSIPRRSHNTTAGGIRVSNTQLITADTTQEYYRYLQRNIYWLCDSVIPMVLKYLS